MSAVPQTRGKLLLGIGLGLLVLAGGVALAGAFLPEWRMGRPLAAEVYRQRYREVAARAGLALAAGEPELQLVTRAVQQLEPYQALGESGKQWLADTGSAVCVAARRGSRAPGGRGGLGLTVLFSFSGQPEAAFWWSDAFADLVPPSFFGPADPLADTLAPALLAPGETLGPRHEERIAALPRVTYPLGGTPGGSRRPQFLFGTAAPTNGQLERRAGPLTPANEELAEDALVETITGLWYRVPAFLGLVGLFVALALRSRLGAVNAAVLALAALASMLPGVGAIVAGPFGFWLAVVRALWVFLLWACAESLLRSTAVDFTTSLDALRAGRLGPRGGRALLVGFGCGAALAGLRLALLALAEGLPGTWAAQFSVPLPLFQPFGSPIAEGIRLAGGVALALALAMRLLPVRWAPAAAAVAAGVFLAPVPVAPGLTAGLLANAAFGGLLVWICRRHGLTALLTACLLSLLLPGALLAGRYADWMPASFAVAAGLSLAVPLLGWVGLTRSAAAEVERLAPPGFVRRLEEERRFRHEMALLAKMQRGLLPRSLPPLPGYELAAHSVLANEAGGDLYDVLTDDEGYVWIAAGDVVVHRYSCSLSPAMVKAALISLVGHGRTPAEVLQRADRVLRGGGLTRNFTSLSLLRLRPETGEALLSNAAHPYPLLLAGGEVREIEISSWPLGLGPPRRYEDRALHLPPGAALVFCSDGLFEASDGSGRVYGFERLGELLRAGGARRADEILETVLADWRRHLRAALPLDDTTIVVLRRREEGR
jgi:hypothetical protein